MPNLTNHPLAWFFTFSQDLFCVAGTDGYFKTVNPAFIQLLGYSEEELLSVPYIAFIHPQDETLCQSADHSFLQGRNSCGFENRIRKKDGSYLRVAWMVVGRGDNGFYMIGMEGNRKQQITQAIIAGQEQERAQIGRELHDNINQMITTLKLYLEMARENETIRMELIEKCHQISASVIEEIRTLSKALLPPLKIHSFRDALQDLIDSFQITQTFKTHFSYSGELDSLPEDLHTCIYRIIQEQLTNIVKHAGATEVVIELIAGPSLSLTIRDNGKGFDNTKRRHGIGLTNIINRADVFNGKVTVFSAPGKGCCLKFIIADIRGLLRKTEVVVER